MQGLWRPSLTLGGVWGSTMSQTWGFGTAIASKFAASRWPVHREDEFNNIPKGHDGNVNAVKRYEQTKG